MNAHLITTEATVSQEWFHTNPGHARERLWRLLRAIQTELGWLNHEAETPLGASTWRHQVLTRQTLGGNMFSKTKATEIECCGRRSVEDGWTRPIGSLYCPRCSREAWMRQGLLVTHTRGGRFFFGSHRAADRFIATQKAKLTGWSAQELEQGWKLSVSEEA